MNLGSPSWLPFVIPVLPALLAGVAAGCASEAPPPTDLTITTDTVGGIVRVTNTGTAPAWQLTPVVSIGPTSLSETGAPEEFGRVNSATLGPDEAVFVADGFNDEVRVFGLDGVHRRTFGRNGDGPGEFRSLYSVAWMGDRLLTLDSRLGRIGEFSADGEWLGQQRVEGSYSGSPAGIRLMPVGPDEFYRLGLLSNETGIESLFVGHNIRGETGRHPVVAPAAAGSSRLHPLPIRWNDHLIFHPVRPGLAQHPGPGAVMYSAMTDAYRIAVTTGNGDTLRVIERPLPPEPSPMRNGQPGIGTSRNSLPSARMRSAIPGDPAGRRRSPSSRASSSPPTASSGWR